MTRKIRMLIVDDSEDERLFMKEGFAQTGLYDIVGEAGNGDEMLEWLNATSELPDLVVSDLNMPGRNGYEVIVDIKTNSLFSHIPVIILTTAPLRPYAERCKKLGACAYYTKPDTFLEYKRFAENIYKDLNDCLDNSTLDFTTVSNPSENLFNNIYSFLAKLFYQSAPERGINTTIAKTG